MGSNIVNLVPLFGAVRNVISLWCLSRMVLTTERPSPVPFCSSLVVKNGSNILSFIDGFIPVPVSVMVTLMYFAGSAFELSVGRVLRSGVVSLVIVMVPLLVMASDALMQRFIRTWWIWDAFP